MNRNGILIISLLVLTFGIASSKSSLQFAPYNSLRGYPLSPIHAAYLKIGGIPLSTGLNFLIRQPVPTFPGDYFRPANAGIGNNLQDIHSEFSISEREEVKRFLNSNVFFDTSEIEMLLNLTCFAYDIRGNHRREAYGMFVDSDTVYVISGWLGKFMSYYRVVPGDFRLTTSEFIEELDKITPLAKNLEGKEKTFHNEADSTNYLHEYIDRDGMFRVRNYLMKTVLPPSPPVGPEQYYNLIEITKFYDKEAIP